jgi:hypothetical protein
VVALAGRLVLAVEHLGREQERAAVDGRLLQVLTERDDSLVHDPDPGPLRPGRLVGCWIDEYGGLPGRQQPLQPALAEEVIGGDQDEQRLTLDLVLDCGQRRAVAVCPPVGVHDPDRPRPSRPTTAATGPGSWPTTTRTRSSPAANRDRTARSTRLRPPRRSRTLEPPPVTDASRSDRPAASTTPTRGSRASGGVGWTMSARWGDAVTGSGGRCGASAMRRLPEEQPG